MDVLTLKENYLIDNPDNIICILENLKCRNPRVVNSTEIRSAIDNELESSTSSLKIDMNTLSVISYSDRLKFTGDIFSFIQVKLHCKFVESLQFVCKCLDIPFSYTRNTVVEEKPKIFGGYLDVLSSYKGILSEGSLTLPKYDESILDNYLPYGAKRFLEDGINLSVQREFKICYDEETHRIVVPWRSPEGIICGLMGRYNGDDYKEKNIAKWLPIANYNFYKSATLFGYSEHYSYLVHNYVFLGESEKFPLQLRSMEKLINGSYKGIYNGIACGGHTISDIQASLIRSLYPKGVIVCFDEGVSFEDTVGEVQKLKTNLFHKFPIGIVYDKESMYLPKGSKMSPSDVKDRNLFEEIIQKCVVWV